MEDTESKDNYLIDTSNVTVSAFNSIKNADKTTTSYVLGRDDTTAWKSPNFKVKVKAWTQDDNNTHTYFHSLSIDVNVDDFMGTAELKCPYDSDLMEYWEPIRQTVVIYGANRGDYKILFIGRVRELKQDGYELVITFQNYGWKFKQNVTQSYAKDNVLNKDGYTIMRLMFEALKIDSWVISESAKKRLKQVGINSDGNLTMNGKEVEKIPDLLKRLQSSDPSKLVNKNTLNNKLREKYLHNIKNINYTLKYEKPSPVMKKIASQGSYSGGDTIYSNPYGSASGSTGAYNGNANSINGSVSGGSRKKNCTVNITQVCPRCKKAPSGVQGALTAIWQKQRDCNADYTKAHNTIVNYARNHPSSYSYNTKPCLESMSKYHTSKTNYASDVLWQANAAATTSGAGKAAQKALSGLANGIGKQVSNFATGLYKGAMNLGNSFINSGKNIVNGALSFLGL